MIDPETLRGCAILLLSLDARAEEIARGAIVEITPETRAWDASHGRHVAHTVTLALDARALARADHGTVDSLTRAFARAIAEDPGASLDRLALRWAGGRRSSSAYRGEGGWEPVSRAEALRDYLDEAGRPDLAASVVEVDETSGGVRVVGEASEAERAALGEHARALFGPGIALSLRLAD